MKRAMMWWVIVILIAGLVTPAYAMLTPGTPIPERNPKYNPFIHRPQSREFWKELQELKKEYSQLIKDIKKDFEEKTKEIKNQINTLKAEEKEKLTAARTEFIDKLKAAIKEGKWTDILGIVKDYRANSAAIKEEYKQNIGEIEKQLAGPKEEMKQAMDALKVTAGEEIKALCEKSGAPYNPRYLDYVFGEGKLRGPQEWPRSNPLIGDENGNGRKDASFHFVPQMCGPRNKMLLAPER